jgi:hypothetical protein
MTANCCRCNKPFGMKSVVPVSVSNDVVRMAHFWCATNKEVSALYGGEGKTSSGSQKEVRQ